MEVVYLAFLFSPVGGNSLEATIQNQNRLVTYMKATVVITNKIISGLKKNKLICICSLRKLLIIMSLRTTFFSIENEKKISVRFRISLGSSQKLSSEFRGSGDF